MEGMEGEEGRVKQRGRKTVSNAGKKKREEESAGERRWKELQNLLISESIQQAHPSVPRSDHD